METKVHSLEEPKTLLLQKEIQKRKEKKRKEKKEKSVGNECISNFESLDFSKLDGDLELFSRDKTN